MAEAPFKGISTLGVDPEPIYAASKEDEDFEIPLHLRNSRTKGPAVVTVEELSEEVIERQANGGDSLPQCLSILLSQALFRVREKILILKTFSRVPRLR